MRCNPVPLIAAILCAYTSIAQTDERYRLSLNTGSFIPEKNILTDRITEFNRVSSRTDNKSFLLIQFEEMPSESNKILLNAAGIHLHEYVPNYAFTATVEGNLSLELLRAVKTRSIVRLNAKQKMQGSLAEGIIPVWATKQPGTVDLWISYPIDFSGVKVKQELASRNMEIIPSLYGDYRIIAVRIAVTRLNELALLPFVEFVQPAPKADEVINDKSISNTKGNILRTDLPGGRNLKGEGVVIGVGDDADLLQHIDFTGRHINRSGIGFGSHGIHVSGTVGGAGLIQERYSGYAPKSTIISQLVSNILAYSPIYVQDHGMVITNNSYGNIVNDCRTFGLYDLYSRVIDQQAYQMPNLQHVFAAGNSGNMNCAPYPAGFNTILGAYQTAKNSISVANISQLGVISASSSKGPTKDGRIKPEIAAQGVSVISSWPYDTYSTSSGTSMASPAVSGGLGLLYQRYRQLHSGANPKNSLMKALLLNGAVDLGPAGPDYTFGFGWMNLLRSVKMLEQNNYFESIVNASGNTTHSITIPASPAYAQLKVMLYWNDSAAAALAAKALVNDLDLEVTPPVGPVVYPQLLDTLPANVTVAATTGVDHFNNVEQVVISNPIPGNYTFTVKGTTIPFGGQHSYVLVFDTIPVSALLTYPIGNEKFEPNEVVNIAWDAFGNSGNDFTLEYSLNNGATWNNITSTAPAGSRLFSWTTPAGASTIQARVRLTQNVTGLQSTSEVFSIIGKPTVSMSAIQCPGYISIDWTAVPGATDYEVMLMRGGEMIPIGVTTGTTYAVGGFSIDSSYWITVRPRISGQPGRRANAINYQPNSGSCTGTISDNDLKLENILSPVSSGRKFTSTELSATSSITIRIRNLDDVPTTGNVPVRYQINAAPAVNQTIVSPNIPAGGFIDYTFTGAVDLSAINNYDLTVSVSYAGDLINQNDTIRKRFKQLDNQQINLITTFTDDFEAAPEQEHLSGIIGLNGLDRYDFITSTIYGRVRTFVNTGIATSGSKALTLDSRRYNPAGTADSIIGTYNLSLYDTTADDVRLDFKYKHHGQVPNAANNVWIRGDDQKPWILAYDLYGNQNSAGEAKLTSSIELRKLLSTNLQNFSPSLQIKWGQWGQIITADYTSAAGYTFDDIRLYRAVDDIQLISIDTPLVASCNLNSTVPVRISVRNSSTTVINNIPVYLEIDGGSPVMEIIPSIPGNSVVVYQFTASANLVSPGLHIVRVWSDLSTDNFADNDSARVILYNSPLITSYPYLQNFEANDGGWHADGVRNTWAYGTPASSRISTAASGIKAWKTRLVGSHNDGEKSYLYSPCFDISGMTSPMLSFHVALDLEDCGGSLCDAAYVEYSADGITWSRLGTTGAGTNWYNKNYSGNHVWSIQNYTRWHVASIPLPTGIGRLRLRFVLESDPYVAREGIAIDDIHIFERQYPIYEGPPYTSSSITQSSLSGSSWVNFIDGSQLIASVNPNGQALGNTDAQAYIYTGSVRNRNSQYYHNRNITIKPANVTLADSASVRFYFLDSETESLLNATGCGYCYKPTMVTQLGITKFSSTNDALENGDANDNSLGNWTYITPANTVKVPYDKGYYAEFKVKDFSEFWLNNGGQTGLQPLPVELTRFTATKSDKDVVLDWVTASEFNTSRFDVEMARGNENYQQNKFEKIGEVSSRGNSSIEQFYSLTDREADKAGVRFYRLRIVDMDGRFTYSPIRPVIFDEDVKWHVYPNPSTGLFNAVFQANPGESIQIRVLDLNGKQLMQSTTPASGFLQKSVVDLSATKYSAGIYLVQIIAGADIQSFRIMKR